MRKHDKNILFSYIGELEPTHPSREGVFIDPVFRQLLLRQLPFIRAPQLLKP